MDTRLEPLEPIDPDFDNQQLYIDWKNNYLQPEEDLDLLVYAEDLKDLEEIDIG